MESVVEIARQVRSKYWTGVEPAAVAASDVRRTAFNACLVTDRVPKGGTVCDVGGGWGLLACVFARLGYKSVLMDDFLDAGFFNGMDARKNMPLAHGVDVVSRDVVQHGMGRPDNSLDAITAFDTLEHWHASPKRMLADAIRALKPGGWLVIGVPNCMNLRKRLTTLFGMGGWSTMADWYEQDVFRGHVREPSVADLKYIARDIGLQDVTVLGRNWQGYLSSRQSVRAATRMADVCIRWRPQLCSDIYLIGRKPM